MQYFTNAVRVRKLAFAKGDLRKAKNVMLPSLPKEVIGNCFQIMTTTTPLLS